MKSKRPCLQHWPKYIYLDHVIVFTSSFGITPPFPKDGCYLSGALCQMITKQLSDACQMSHQTFVNFHQTSVRQVPYMRHMSGLVTFTQTNTLDR